MRRNPLRRGFTGCPEALRPYRHLAVRVIDQALRDLAGDGDSAKYTKSARGFLAGSAMLSHWCEVADLDPEWMVAHARKLVGISTRRPGSPPNGH